MIPQLTLICTTFTTLSAGIELYSSVTYFVIVQTYFLCKPFVTHRTHIRTWLVILWMLSDIITISFSLNVKDSVTCTAYKTTFYFEEIVQEARGSYSPKTKALFPQLFSPFPIPSFPSLPPLPCP